MSVDVSLLTRRMPSAQNLMVDSCQGGRPARKKNAALFILPAIRMQRKHGRLTVTLYCSPPDEFLTVFTFGRVVKRIFIVFVLSGFLTGESWDSRGVSSESFLANFNHTSENSRSAPTSLWTSAKVVNPH